jgi:hypothetical protein
MVSIQYAKPIAGLKDREGKTSSLCVFGIPPSAMEEAVMADVEAETGVRPISVDQPDGQQFAFLDFKSAKDAKHALEKGFKIASRTLGVGYNNRGIMRKETENDWSDKQRWKEHKKM